MVSDKLAGHLDYFGLSRTGLLEPFWDLAAKGSHSFLEVSVKVENDRIYPGRSHLYHYLEERDIFRAWADFREFADALRDATAFQFDDGLFSRFEAALPGLDGALQLGVGVDLRNPPSHSRVKFGLAAEPLSPAMMFFLDELRPGQCPGGLRRHVRTAGFDLGFDGRSSLKVYP